MLAIEAKILATLIALQPPGVSPYSRLEVPQDSPAPCDAEFSPLCFAPRWTVERQAWTVAEPADAAHERYATIAHAIVWETWRVPPSRRAALRRYLAAVFYHESGFREDVHAGFARGDAGRSVCLGQVLYPNARHKHFGFSKHDLVGTGEAATKRCARVAVRVLERAWTRCGGDRPVCVFGVYGGVSEPAKHPLIAARVATYGGLP